MGKDGADGWIQRASDRLGALLELQRPNLPLWTPVLFGAGIAVYFALPVEPAPWLLAALAATALALIAAMPVAGPLGRLGLEIGRAHV